MAVTRYDAKNSTITVKGVFITGLAEDFWSFSKKEAIRSSATGGVGDVVISETNDPVWEATVKVQTTSPQANFLLELRKETVPFPVWNINKQLGRKEGGAQALMTEAPSDDHAKEAGELEFKFEVYDGDIIIE